VSIADAVRARDLEARVTALEQHFEESSNAVSIRAPKGESPHGTDLYLRQDELDHRVKMLQGQINSLRAKIDRLVPPGPPGSIDAA
jgi:hypothetical protein